MTVDKLNPCISLDGTAQRIDHLTYFVIWSTKLKAFTAQSDGVHQDKTIIIPLGSHLQCSDRY